MGVKSTVTITRAEAESRVVDAILEVLKISVLIQVKMMSNTTLENMIEIDNDKKYEDGQGFENYRIEG